MNRFEKISHRIALTISDALSLNREQSDILEYGAIHLLLSLWNYGLILFFGFLFEVLFETILITVTVSLLRRHCGGFHASSPAICTGIGLCVCLVMSSLVKYVLIDADLRIHFLFIILLFIFSNYIMMQLAPVDSPAKRIQHPLKRKSLKKKSILLLNLLFFLTGCSLYFYEISKNPSYAAISLCIPLGILWQTFTLTQLGHSFLGKLDIRFKKS